MASITFDGSAVAVESPAEADSHSDILKLAARLLAAGVPVVFCPARTDRSDGHTEKFNPLKKPKADLIMPKGWSTVLADDCDLRSVDLTRGCLAMVSGHGVDVLDIDAKDGGDPDYLPEIETFGTRRTPSGGWHLFVRSTGFAKKNGWRVDADHFLGDYCGGSVEGGGRALVYLGGYRPKYEGRGYSTEVEIDIMGCLAAQPDATLVTFLGHTGASAAGKPGKPAADYAECEAFLAEHSAAPIECGYGRKAVGAMLADAWGVEPGDPVKGRHAWAIRTGVRLVELMRAGCAWAADFTAFAETLERLKPEEDPYAALAWGITNAAGTVTCSTHTAAEGASEGDELQELEDAFFGASEILEQVRQGARARMVSPWAVIGCLLSMVAAANDPKTQVPALVGSRASLNFASALVGPSGSGKSTASDTAEELLGGWPIYLTRIGAGTGEGVTDTFLTWDADTKTMVLRQFPNAYCFIDEISMIGAVQDRSGSSLASVLRSMLTGGEVSFTNASTKLRRHLAKRSYSLGMVAGVQPEKADILLADADAGTPQRWLWLPATDPLLPDEAPEWPGELETGLGAAESATGLWVDSLIEDFVKNNRRQTMRGAGDALDGHAVLTRVKVTALLARLHGDSGVSRRWWNASEPLMEMSKLTRTRCQQALAEKHRRIEAARGIADHTRRDAADAARRVKVERVAKTVATLVYRHADGEGVHGTGACPKRCLMQGTASRDRHLLDEAIVIAVEHFEWLEQVPGGSFKRGSSRPA